MDEQTFDAVLEKLSSYLKNTKAVESTSKLFGRCENDFERIAVVYSLLHEAKLLPSHVEKTLKSSTASEKHRIEGNEAFRKKQDKLALQYYTSCIAFAPNRSKELALGFANRSAVNYSSREYLFCIADIDYALAGEYPDHLKYKLYERKGRCMLQMGMKSSAKESFQMCLKWLRRSQLDAEKQKHVEEEITKLTKLCNENDTLENRKETSLPELSYGQSDEILSASSAVRIEYNCDMGRHIVAARDILPGDVLIIEKSYASVLLPDVYSTYCSHCLQRSNSLIPCDHCTMVLYCSESCRAQNWEQSHRIECDLLPSLLKYGSNKMELLAVRILLVATSQGTCFGSLIQQLTDIEFVKDERTKAFDHNGFYNSADYRTTHHLIGNSEHRQNSDMFRRALIATCILHFIDKLTNFFSTVDEINYNGSAFKQGINISVTNVLDKTKILAGSLILRYLQSMPCNAHEVSEMCVARKGNEFIYDSIEIGGAAYPVLSLINHCCDPNVVRHSYRGDTVVLTAIQCVDKGEQIFDNYGFHHAVHDFPTRQSHLISQYYFKCQCIACQDDWPLYHDLPETHPSFTDDSLRSEVEKSSKAFREVLEDIICGKTEGKLPFLCSHLKLLHKAVKRPWKEYNECQEAIKQCLSLQANHYISDA